ncbi:MAG: hypothetical protein J0I14_11210 [Propionibacteriaceae bacterium]|nr:hypothetical protein [Propionibacteriaceae bacterium]
MTSWLRVLGAEVPLLRELPSVGERPLPRIAADTGPSVPGWALRLGAAVATGTVLAIGTQRVGTYAGVGWTVVGLATALMLIWPAPILALAAMVVSGLLVALDGYGPFDPVVFALIPLAYSAVRLAWWAERVAPGARVELAALGRGLPGGLAATGGAVAVGGLTFGLVGRPSAVGVIAGGVALVALAGLLLAAQRHGASGTMSGRMES